MYTHMQTAYYCFSCQLYLNKQVHAFEWIHQFCLWWCICSVYTYSCRQALCLKHIMAFFSEAASQFIYLGSRAYCCSCELPSSSLLIQQVRHERKGMQIYPVCFIYYIPQVGLGSGFSVRISDFSFTNSLATSSLVLCDSILRIVHPVSSIWIRLPSDSQHAHEPCSTMSLSCITATPTRRSSRAKQ